MVWITTVIAFSRFVGRLFGEAVLGTRVLGFGASRVEFLSIVGYCSNTVVVVKQSTLTLSLLEGSGLRVRLF